MKPDYEAQAGALKALLQEDPVELANQLEKLSPKELGKLMTATQDLFEWAAMWCQRKKSDIKWLGHIPAD